MSRVALAQIRSITLYKGELTKSRRTPPIPQLKCVGKACRLFQPEVVRCHNNGGSGVDIDWTCEADLPEKLRFGRIDVSCEGWNGPGDPYVLKGSCGLEYHFVNIADNQNDWSWSGWFNKVPWNEWLERFFLYLIIFLGIYLIFGSYIRQFLSWLKRFFRSGPSSSNRNNRGGPGGPGGSSGFFSSGNHRPRPRPPHDYPPPPPYTEHPSKSDPSSSSNSSNSTGPGFWSGVGLGGLGGFAASRLFNRDRPSYYVPPPEPVPGPYTQYDWEHGRLGRTGGLFGSGSTPSWFSRGSAQNVQTRPAPSRDNDRGEGPSNLGRMRRSTGYGVTNVR